MNETLKIIHHFGTWLWLAGLSAYWLLRYKKQDFLTEGYRAYFKRRFTPLAIFGMVIIFGSGMGLLITANYVGIKTVPTWFTVKMILFLLLFIAGLNAWGIDVGVVKRIDELKVQRREIPVEEMHSRIGKINKIMDIFIYIAIFLTILVFIIAHIKPKW
ncbi:MAG: hypothetical protein NZ519_06455 [Bacteroidia bacterium]|nr:hypothetical protein [Bacteroidia bacterium]MDW8302800.1 hypothetical protein [Bacteroidia bacterium]